MRKFLTQSIGIMSEKKELNPLPPKPVARIALQGKVLLITGAASGSIGGCTAIRAARKAQK
ncbi:MAG: hypothetical protein IPH20_26200 [Bacteroidales bacterium]|nr:hypothetical protein [Bacteroidales bacterium]